MPAVGRKKIMQLLEFKNLISNMPVSYQAFTSKKSTRNDHLSAAGSAGDAIRNIFGNADEITLSRNYPRRLAIGVDLAKFVMATIIWGYPRGMRGNHVANLINHFVSLTQLLSASREQPVADWNTHYDAVGQIEDVWGQVSS